MPGVARLALFAVPGLPLFAEGDPLAALILDALERAALPLEDGDVVVVTSKALSRVEGCFVDLSTVAPSDEARALAAEIGKDPAMVELVLRDTERVSRRAPGVLIVRHRLGFVSANAGIDQSNAAPPGAPPGSGPYALVMPRDPDASAAALLTELERATGRKLGVVISDSLGRPFRVGTVGAAIGVAGVPAVWDQVGRTDLHGRVLEHTVTGFADQVAATADLLAGQADEGRPVVVVRGLALPPGPSTVGPLLRDPDADLYL
jgi:coenzyme F420-0:L-glutamate ligase/coenzyme F420-1:gamma-L-glutamate ligase